MTNQEEKKITKTYETEHGYVISSLEEGESELDPNSLLYNDNEAGEESKLKFVSNFGISKEITLIKDGIEYKGNLDKFNLTESSDGRTKIKVVFYLAK